ncbi:MAG: hypothetical protein ACLGI2_09245 [Acidimicrobiia bacterium]
MGHDKLDRRIAVGVTVLGLATIATGIAISHGRREAVVGALVNIGVAIGLVVVLIAIERRVVRRVESVARDVAESTAQETADRATADLRDRVVRLENLDEALEEARQRRRAEEDAAVTRVRTTELSAASIGTLHAGAIRDRLLSERCHVRTSADPMCPVLYVLSLVADEGVSVIWLDFRPLQFQGRTITIEDQVVPVPEGDENTVMWVPKDNAADIAVELETALDRSNQPRHGFDFGFAIEQLARSVEVMRAARAAPAGDARRMEGELEILINESWAYTTYGLEAIYEAHAFPLRFPRDGGRQHLFVRELPCDDDLAAALTWVSQREGQVSTPPEN